MKRLMFLVSLLLVATMVVPAAAQDEPVTFVWGSYGNPVQLYAAVVTDGVSFNPLYQGCESLLAFDGSTTNVKESMATAWESNEDAILMSLKLTHQEKEKLLYYL